MTFDHEPQDAHVEASARSAHTAAGEPDVAATGSIVFTSVMIAARSATAQPSFLRRGDAGRLSSASRAEELRGGLVAARREDRAHEYLPLAGQSAGAIHEILPAAEIVRRIVTRARQRL